MKEWNFWKAALARAARTFAQTALGIIGVSIRLEAVDWIGVLSGACLAAVLSLLTSVATGLPEVRDDGQ